MATRSTTTSRLILPRMNVPLPLLLLLLVYSSVVVCGGRHLPLPPPSRHPPPGGHGGGGDGGGRARGRGRGRGRSSSSSSSSSFASAAAVIPFLHYRGGGAAADVDAASASGVPPPLSDASAASEESTTTTTTTVATKTDEKTATAATTTTTTTTKSTRKRYRVLQVQIVHRHGDRTPITPLANEAYWASQLPHPAALEKIAEGTRLVRDDDDDHDEGGGGGERRQLHSAGGRGPFGQLTNLGLMQMVELGSRLREELHLDFGDGDGERTVDGDGEIILQHHLVDDEGHCHVNHGRLFTPADPIHPRHVRVTSTDFPRTVQSVRALLVGLFPDGLPHDDDDDDVLEIDVRHTSRLIPDPQPRTSYEQAELERELAGRPHLAEREEEMRDLAARATEALRGMLGRGHDEVSFGVGEEKEKEREEGAPHPSPPLPWTQLAEITKCLEVRDLLPPAVTASDVRAISSHTAWRWFHHLRHPRLARLAMGGMASDMLDAMRRGVRRRRLRRGRRRRLGQVGGGDEEEKKEEEEEEAVDATEGEGRKREHEQEPRLRIYSAHDSTLIGLLCAFRLEQPSEWPEYGSYIKVELIEAETIDEDGTVVKNKKSRRGGDCDGDGEGGDVEDEHEEAEDDDVDHFVRFSLNGEVLRCRWGVGEDGRWEAPSEGMVPLERLTAMVRREHHDHDDPFHGEEGGSGSGR